jgi:tight adherence protein C
MLIIVVLCVGCATFFLLSGLTSSQRDVAVSLKRAKSYGGFSLRDSELTRGLGERLFGPLAQRLARIALRVSPGGSLDAVRRRLIAAGMTRTSPTSYLAAKLAAAGFLATLGLAMVAVGRPPQAALLVGLAGAGGAFAIPDYVLSLRTRGRKDEIVSQLPDVLDLLTVSVEAGMGFDAAVMKVCERMEGPLIQELSIVLHEMRIGESRSKALKSFGERLDLPETTSFARSIIQADQLGIALGKILRVQAQDMRHRRQMAAEERAMKAPVKMLFPTAIFIFPALFIVVLGPAMLSLLKLFS